MQQVEKWGVFEIALNGRSDGNPFTDYSITGTFTNGADNVTVSGFYDGDGVYKVRFMPQKEGSYHYQISGSFGDGADGEFTVTAPKAGNHGMVHVANKFHFAYADGKKYFPLGTTCYAFTHQKDEVIAETFASLKESAFNKIRFCIFPKHYDYNFAEPRSYPYVGTPVDSSNIGKDNFWNYIIGDKAGNDWDFSRFNPEHFQHIEKCIVKLMEMGIEADIILMHPYDRWGFSTMTQEEDERYFKYVLARFGAYRNVWWSLSNEFDLIFNKTEDDWENLARVVVENDPYKHLRSIHSCMRFYDYNREWITHASIQRQEMYRTAELTDEWREKWQKPVVLDEIGYEGNVQYGWGNLSGEEMLRRFWEGAVRGGYPGHGETYLHESNLLWWSHGGKLRGESWKRIGFLLKIMEETPGHGWRLKGQSENFTIPGTAPNDVEWDDICAVPEDEELAERTGWHLYYYSFMQPSFRDYYLDDENEYKVEVIDTWNMTITDAGIHKGKFSIKLPGRPYMAIRMAKANS